jgi:hypothetical protein
MNAIEMINTSTLITEQRNYIHNARQSFFESIVDAIQLPPGDIDRELNQSSYYIQAMKEQIIIDKVMGNLFIPFEIEQNENEIHRFAYSIYQTGEEIKIGVIFYDKKLYGAPGEDSESEAAHLWEDEPEAIHRGEGVLYEWKMAVPNLYEKWLQQERFILGMRHMHFRMMRIIKEQLEIKEA